MKAPDYQIQLRTIAPSIAFSVEWERDEYASFPSECGDQGDLECYDVDFYARAVVEGEIVEGATSLCGTWEHPDKIDPEVGGYLPQKLQEAAEDLMNRLREHGELLNETRDAAAFLQKVLQDRYDKQQKDKPC